MHILAFFALGLVLLVGHMTCAVLASGKRHAEERYEVWTNELWRRQAEARLRALGDEQRRYAEAAVAVRLTSVEREIAAVVEATGFR